MQEINSREKNICVVVNGMSPAARKHLGNANYVHEFSANSIKSKVVSQARHLFVVSNSIGVSDLTKFVSHANSTHQLKSFLINEDSYAAWIPRILDMAGLRTLKNLLVFSDWAVPKRIIEAWKYGNENLLIADAAVFDDKLYVQDCALNTFIIPFEKTKPLRKIPVKNRRDFSISQEGASISWDAFDVEFDIDLLREIIEPERIAGCKLTGMAMDAMFGKAVANFRKQSKVSQNDVKGLSDRQVRRIENGEFATLKSIENLANAHGLPLDVYLTSIAKEIARLHSS